MSQAGSLGVGGSGRSTTVAVSTFQPNVVIQEFDDFLSGDTAHSSSTLGSKLQWDANGGFDAINGTITNPGIISFPAKASGVSSTWLGVRDTGGAALSGCVATGGGAISMSFIAQLTSLSAGANTYIYDIGFCDDLTIRATNRTYVNGIYFSYTDTTNAGQWTINCTNASVTTTVNTAVAATTAFTTFTIVVNAGGTSVSFYINNVQVGTAITTNIPTAAITPFFQAKRTAGTMPIMNVDLFYIDIALTTPRPGPTFSQAVVGTGQLIEQYVQTAVSYQVLNSDAIIGVSNTAAARTITMPASSLVTGQRWTVKDESGGAATNNITISGNGKNIDGAATYVITTNYGAVDLYYNGTQFYLI